MSYLMERNHALKRADDLEHLADILERDREALLAGETRRRAEMIRALWSDPE